MNHYLINRDELRRDKQNYELEGAQYGATGLSLILVDVAPGQGPRLHVHPYEEILVVQEGQATVTIGATTLEVSAGQIAIVPPGVPHAFVNSGTGPLRQLDIHHSPQFLTTWLDE